MDIMPGLWQQNTATDSLGLHHKTIIDKFELNENSDRIQENEWMWLGEVIITDKEGTILYAPHYEKVN